jgi:protein gp37
VSSNSKNESRLESWNPTTGCTKVSPGCKNCYAKKIALRLKGMGIKKYERGFLPTAHESVLELPIKWKKPRIIFVSSMGDLFHEDIPTDFIKKTFDVMEAADRHIFQILTKRSFRLLDIKNELPWPENIWMGVTVEDDDHQFRIGHLKSTDAHIKFLCMEPLLGPIPELALDGIDWVIVGGESGPNARPMAKEWVTGIRDQCIFAKVPFCFKQWGGRDRKKTGRLLEGKIHDEMPAVKKTESQYSLALK